jgi:hypothetical protein
MHAHQLPEQSCTIQRVFDFAVPPPLRCQSRIQTLFVTCGRTGIYSIHVPNHEEVGWLPRHTNTRDVLHRHALWKKTTAFVSCDEKSCISLSFCTESACVPVGQSMCATAPACVLGLFRGYDETPPIPSFSAVAVQTFYFVPSTICILHVSQKTGIG